MGNAPAFLTSNLELFVITKATRRSCSVQLAHRLTEDLSDAYRREDVRERLSGELIRKASNHIGVVTRCHRPRTNKINDGAVNPIESCHCSGRNVRTTRRIGLRTL